MKEVMCKREEQNGWKEREKEGLDEQVTNMTKYGEMRLQGNLLTGGGGVQVGSTTRNGEDRWAQ